MTNVENCGRAHLTDPCVHTTSISRCSRSAAALAFFVALAVPDAALAHDVTGACALVMDPNNAPSTDPRIEHISVAGTNVNVLLPPGYRQDQGRRYPVLYLLHRGVRRGGAFYTH